MDHDTRVKYLKDLFKKKEWDKFAIAFVKHMNLTKEESVQEIFQEIDQNINATNVVQSNTETLQIFTENL